jgi:hypothetical protein
MVCVYTKAKPPMQVEAKALVCSRCETRFDNNEFVVLTHANDLYRVWQLRRLITKPGAISQALQLTVNKDRDRLPTHQIGCSIEFICITCNEKRITYESRVLSYIMRHEKQFACNELLDFKRRSHADRMPWSGSTILQLMALDAHPYLDAVIPVDGRELDPYKEEGTGLVDWPRIRELADPVMPYSYQLHVRQTPNPECFELISRYIRLHYFDNSISVFAVKTLPNSRNWSSLEDLASDIRKGLFDRDGDDDDDDRKLPPHSLWITKTHVDLTGTHEQGTLLVILFTRIRDVPQHLASSIGDRSFKPSCSVHSHVERCLRKIKGTTLEPRQMPLPIYSYELRNHMPVKMSSGPTEKIEANNNALLEDMIIFSMNCCQLSRTRQAFYGVAEGRVFRASLVNPNSAVPPPPIPILYKQQQHANAVNNASGVVIQMLEVLDSRVV